MKLATLLLLALAALSPTVVSAQTRYATQALRVRAEPSATAAVVATVPVNSAVQVNGCNFDGGVWCSVQYLGSSGYVAARFLSSGNGIAPANGNGVRHTPGGTAVRRTPRRTHLSSAARSSSRRARSTSSGSSRRASASSRGYYTGPRGGCYTYSASGRKRYVDHSYCN